MRRSVNLAVFGVVVLALALVPPAGAHDDLPFDPPVPVPVPENPVTHGPDDHSDNMSLVANWDDDGTYRQGSDLAFWGNLAVLGNYDNPGGFRVVDISDPRRPRPLGQFTCRGPQSDVSIAHDLVFVSVDTPQPGTDCPVGTEGGSFEGIRIVSIADKRAPEQLAVVRTDCGSHTHTLVPDLKHRDPDTGELAPRVLLYVLSYPLGGQGPTCNAATHRKISVVEVPLRDPASARVISTPDVSPAIGCHDVTVYPERDLAGAACISESQLWDISDPAHPRIISHIVNPAINIHHSTTFDWEAETLVIGDELGGAAASPGCFTAGHAPVGALWFYDVTDPAAPQVAGTFQIPQVEPSAFCTAHNFNPIPLRDGRDVLVSAWYNGGTTVVDFTDPSQPTQVGYYMPREGVHGAAWSSYWYRGFIYANNFDEDVNSLTARSRGFDVFELDDPIVASALPVPSLNAQTMERPPALPPG